MGDFPEAKSASLSIWLVAVFGAVLFWLPLFLSSETFLNQLKTSLGPVSGDTHLPSIQT